METKSGENCPSELKDDDTYRTVSLHGSQPGNEQAFYGGPFIGSMDYIDIKPEEKRIMESETVQSVSIFANRASAGGSQEHQPGMRETCHGGSSIDNSTIKSDDKATSGELDQTIQPIFVVGEISHLVNAGNRSAEVKVEGQGDIEHCKQEGEWAFYKAFSYYDMVLVMLVY